MTSENQKPNPYAAALADLRAKREKIDNTIRVLEELSGLTLGTGPGGDFQFVPMTGDNGIEETSGMFLGMSIVDAAKKLLAMRKRTLSNTEILAELKAGGLVLTGADPLNVVGSVLTRRFNKVGDVVRVGRGVWGLKEWYPGRNFKAPKGGDSERPGNAGEAESVPDDRANMLSDLEQRLSQPIRAVPDE